MMTLLSTKLSDAMLLAQASLALLRIDIALRNQGFNSILLQLDSLETRPAASLRRRDVRAAQRYARRIADAARFSLPRVRCLHRSLVLHTWLRRRGLPSELKIGVMRDHELLSAHAWVELGGQLINDQRGAVNSFTLLSGQRLGNATESNHTDLASPAEPRTAIETRDYRVASQPLNTAQRGNRS